MQSNRRLDKKKKTDPLHIANDGECLRLLSGNTINWWRTKEWKLNHLSHEEEYEIYGSMKRVGVV